MEKDGQFISLEKDSPPWGKNPENTENFTGNKLNYVYQKLRVGPYMLRFEELPLVRVFFFFLV